RTGGASGGSGRASGVSVQGRGWWPRRGLRDRGRSGVLVGDVPAAFDVLPGPLLPRLTGGLVPLLLGHGVPIGLEDAAVDDVFLPGVGEADTQIDLEFDRLVVALRFCSPFKIRRWGMAPAGRGSGPLEARAVVPDQGAHPVRGPVPAAGALVVVLGELDLAALAGQEVGAGDDRPRLAGGGLVLAVHPPLRELVGDPELLREAEQPVQHLDHVGALHAGEGDADLHGVVALGGLGEHVGSSEIGGWSGWGVARLKAGP